MTPKHLESFVSCNCVKGTCSTNNCSCKKNGVRFIPSVCGHCTDERCENLEPAVSDGSIEAHDLLEGVNDDDDANFD